MPEARITVGVVKGDDGQSEVLLYCNAEGRALLIQELQRLDETNDHFHLYSEEWGGEELRTHSYDGKPVAHHLKVLFRPDHWDEEHYPHVMKL